MTEDDHSETTEEIEDAEELLVVDDDESFRRHLSRALRRRGFSVHQAADYGEAMVIAREIPLELAVLDLRMPGEDGLELLRALLDERPDIEAIVLTGYGSIPTAVDAVRLGAVNYLQKPADADDILAAFERGQKPPLADADRDYEAPSLERAEWEHIQRVLADCGGNISKAARQLGIHRRTLQRKLNRAPDSE